MTSATERIDEIVRGNDIVLFMKGTELFPQCGFSSRAVAILDHLGVHIRNGRRAAGSGDPAGHKGILRLADRSPSST